MTNKLTYKIIFITDSQIRGTNPKGRVDDFPAALKAKFREVFQMARKLNEYENCCIVHGGDLFDSPDLSYSVAGEFAALLMECPVPFYVVPGNHDEYAHNLDTVHRTVLGLLARVGVVKILGREPELLWVELDDTEGDGTDLGRVAVQLTGQGFHPRMDMEPGDYMSPDLAEAGVYRVHVVHGMLVKDGFPGPHTTITGCQTNADVVLTGHEHQGYGLVAREFSFGGGTVIKDVENWCKTSSNGDTTIFCNPGALARVDASAEDMLRPVQVAVFEFSNDGIEARLVPLKCAAPGSEVLSREHIVKAAEREEMMNKFLGLLAREGEMKFLSVQEIVNNIAQRKQLPQQVVDDVLVRIGRAREELGRKKVG